MKQYNNTSTSFFLFLGLGILGLVLGSLICCKATKQQPAVEPEQAKTIAPNPEKPIKISILEFNFNAADSLFASIERTPCYGRCPTYKISVYKSGYVIYEGIRFVERLGTFSTQVGEREIQSIIKKANEVGYFNLNEVYDSPVTDLPSTITYLSVKGQKKTIKDRVSGPEALREYEKFIDGIFEDVEWKEIKILKD